MEKRITPTNSSTLVTPTDTPPTPTAPPPNPTEPLSVTPEPTQPLTPTPDQNPTPTPSTDQNPTPTIPQAPTTTPNTSATFNPAPIDTPISNPVHRRVRPVRLLLWLITIVALSIGLSLRARSQTSLAFTNGTHTALASWAKFILWPASILAILNFLWGAARWFLRWHNERWRLGQVISKLIGGGIWRFFAIIPIISISLFFLAPSAYRAIASSAASNTLSSSDALLASAYATGEIDADAYLTYLLDATYNPSALPEPYQSSEPLIMAPNFLDFIDQHFDELSPDLILSTLETVSLASIDFDTDASGNISSSPSLFAQNAYAVTTNVTTLNKALLSPNQKFVIFYTDTGDDAISDQSATTVANMLDSIIEGYSSSLSLQYEYQLFSTSNSKAKKMTKILEANGIDGNITETAMAVYIANPYKKGSNILATYAGRRFADTFTNITIKLGNVFGEETAKLYASTPAYPFINILPSNLSDNSLALVTAHELGHHYASNYCYSATNTNCNDNDFIDETAPNWFAVNVITNQPSDNLIQSHHNTYINYGTCYTISEVISEPPKEHACHSKGSMLGYPAVAFLQNYSEIVPNATDKILTALTVNDALQSLYNSAGQDNFKKTMTQLTERNLTNSYGSKVALYATDLPRGEEIPCTDLCTQSYYIAPASSRYLYFPTAEFSNTNLDISAPSSTISILGQRNNTWTVIYSQDQTITFDMADAANYDTIAFGIANYSISEPNNFTLQVTAKPLEELVDENASDPDLELGDLPVTLLSDNCIGIDFDGVLDFPLKLYRILSQIDTTNDYSEAFAEIEAQNAVIKSQLVYHYASICVNRLKPGTDFNSAKAYVRQLSKPNLEFFNINDPDMRLSMIASYNPLQLEGKFYFLMQVDDSTDLITVRMLEKLPTTP